MADIGDLTYFEVVRTVSPVPSGVLTADVMFEAQVTKGIALQADIAAEVIEILTRPVYARLVDGVLMQDGTAGVQLLSAAEVAIDGGFSYLVTFTNARMNGVSLRDPLKSLTFPAPDDGTEFDLKDAAPVITARADPTARGPRGYKVTGGHFTGGNLVLENADASETTGIVPVSGVLIFADNGDGSWAVG